MKQLKLLSLLAAMVLSVTTAMATDVASVTTSADVTTNYASFSDALSAWGDGCTLQLLAAVETSSTIAVSSGTKTLDLNGYGIKMTGGRSVFLVTGSSTAFTIMDSRPDTPHKYSLTSTRNNNRAGLATLNEGSGTKTVNGGYITGGETRNSNGHPSIPTGRGGGICCVGATIHITGGNLIGNRSTTGWGGGIYLHSGTITMSGTAGILYNRNTGNGQSGAGVFVEFRGTFIMNGGVIKGNVSEWQGGGIHTDKGATLIVNDGIIEDNYAAKNGGGIRVISNDSGSQGYSSIEINGGIIRNNYSIENGGGIEIRDVAIPIKMSGNPVITGNSSALNTNNLYLRTNEVITIIGEMTEGANVNITMQTPGAFTTGYSTYNSEAPAEYFTINAGSYVPLLNGSGEVRCAAIQNLAAGQDPQNDGEYYSTFFDSSQQFLLEDGVEAYVGELRSSLLHLTRIAVGGQVIPANTAVILKADHQPVVLTPTDASPVSVESNDLQGADYTLSAPANCYVLSSHSADYTINEIGFYQFTGTLGAHKAYLIISAGSGAPSRLRFVFSEENAATGMEAISNQQSAISSQKQIENGQLIIIRDGIRYNAQGMIVK